MLLKDAKRLSLLIGPLLIVLYLTVSLLRDSSGTSGGKGLWGVSPPPSDASATDLTTSSQDEAPAAAHSELDEVSFDEWIEETHSESQEKDRETSFSDADEPPISDESEPRKDDVMVDENSKTHLEIFSKSTPDRKYFHIDFGNVEAMNPNIIPHPHLDNTWLVVAQRVVPTGSLRFTEIICSAAFDDGVLRCIEPPGTLPIAPSTGDLCTGEYDYFSMNIGPHDARVFMGPKGPLVVYGSNSVFTCFGQFVQDLRALTDWGNNLEDFPGPEDFRVGTELQRPPPWSPVEKNWFLFWDVEGRTFVHHDITPNKRVFSQVNQDGSVGLDLSVFAHDQDARCMQKFLPHLAAELESIHQATNSLQITLCQREDTGCVPDEGNTFIFTIFQHKTYYNFHSEYEPYVMLFRNQAPFDIYAISRLPLWIHGREKRPDSGNSSMFYVTSMGWKMRGQNYEGYLDDEMFLAFGIEDTQAGGIDVRASDILDGLQLCESLK
jgi:hypothetical protein